MDDSDLLIDKNCMLDVVMIAKQYSEEEEENHVSIDSVESGLKRKSSTNEESKDKEVDSNSSIVFVGEDLVVEEGESETKRLKKNEQSFNCEFNNDAEHFEVLFMSGKGKILWMLKIMHAPF
jgi:hypothetical protein